MSKTVCDKKKLTAGIAVKKEKRNYQRLKTATKLTFIL